MTAKKKYPWEAFAALPGIYELHKITKARAEKENLADGIWEQLAGLKALGVKGVWFMLTPRAAQHLLDTKLRNRDQVTDTVTRYATYIVNGMWDARIVDSYIDDELRLIEARHRCEAVVLTERSIVCGMVVGVNKNINENVGQGTAIWPHMAVFRMLDFEILAPSYTVAQSDVRMACSVCAFLDRPLSSHRPKRHTTELAAIITAYLPEILDIVQYFPTSKRDGTVNTMVKAAFFLARISGDMKIEDIYKCAALLIDGGTERSAAKYNVISTLRERLQTIKLLGNVKGGSKRDYPERMAFAATMAALYAVAKGKGKKPTLPDMKGGEIAGVLPYIDLFEIPADRKAAIPHIEGSKHC